MTLADWEEELRGLRSGALLGTATPMRVTWWQYGSAPRAAPTIALFEADAAPKDRAIVKFNAEPAEVVRSLEQGALVEVYGSPRPGGAVVLRAGGAELWGVEPANATALMPRFDARPSGPGWRDGALIEPPMWSRRKRVAFVSTALAVMFVAGVGKLTTGDRFETRDAIIGSALGVAVIVLLLIGATLLERLQSPPDGG